MTGRLKGGVPDANDLYRLVRFMYAVSEIGHPRDTDGFAVAVNDGSRVRIGKTYLARAYIDALKAEMREYLNAQRTLAAV